MVEVSDPQASNDWDIAFNRYHVKPIVVPLVKDKEELSKQIRQILQPLQKLLQQECIE